MIDPNLELLRAAYPWMGEAVLRANAHVLSCPTPAPIPAISTPKKEKTRARRTTAPLKTDRLPQGSQPERPLCDESLAPQPRKTLYPGRVLVRITCYRRRSLDTDNVCAKWFLDAARYSHLIRDDRPEDIELQVSQQKVKTEKEERTEIELIPL